MRPRRRLRMILHTVNRFGFMAHAFNRVVVQVNAVNDDLRWQRFWIYRKTVVLRRNLDFAGFEVFHRLICTAMTKLKLEGLSSESLAQNLVTQADSENGNVCFDKFPDGVNGITKSSRVPRAVGEKNSGRLISHRFSGGCCRGNDLHFKPMLPETAQDVVFHA